MPAEPLAAANPFGGKVIVEASTRYRWLPSLPHSFTPALRFFLRSPVLPFVRVLLNPVTRGCPSVPSPSPVKFESRTASDYDCVRNSGRPCGHFPISAFNG